MKKLVFAIVFTFCIVSTQSFAQIDLRTTAQSPSVFANEVGTLIWFNPVEIAEGYGMFGLSASVSITSADIDRGNWVNFADFDPGSTMYITSFTLRKGLTERLSVGFRFSDYSDLNANSWGLEAKYVFLKGSAIIPAVSGRVSYSKLTGSDLVDANVMSAGIMVSKGFLNFTPYCGVSFIRSDIDVYASEWQFSETSTDTQLYAGVRITFIPFVAITGEVVKGEITKYTVKAGIRF